MAFITLLFPFQYMHILIPILPEKLKVFVDAPVPFLIGILFKIDLNDIPADAIVYNLESNTFDRYLDRLPKLTPKLAVNLLKRLDKYKLKFRNKDEENKFAFIDEVFTFNQENFETNNKFDCQEIRDIFFEFFLLMFKNYEKYFGFKNRKVRNGIMDPLIFNQELFLKDHSSTEVN